VFLQDVLLWVDMVERIQLLVVFSAHAFFLSGCVVRRVFWYAAAVPRMGPNDAPAALVMGAGFLAFGLTMILRPGNVRGKLDHFADSWKQGSWDPYKTPDWGLRLTGVIGMAAATLIFYIFYIAYVALHHSSVRLRISRQANRPCSTGRIRVFRRLLI